MNATQLEALVIQAVDAVRAGASPEDDRIEIKRDWPTTEKVRQLAAAANQSQGDYVIYVVGLDETDGSVHPVGGTDPATWWAQLEARFDEVAPELVSHINVALGSGEWVVGLLFRTDRAPYVIKLGSGAGAEREVPIRAGTRTRSAKRNELLRLLLPAINVPRLEVISAEFSAAPPYYMGGNSENESMLRFTATVFIEHSGDAAILMPKHAASVEATGGAFRGLGKLFMYGREGDGPESAIYVRPDGVRVSESGTFEMGAEWVFRRDQLDELCEIDAWSVRIEFPVSRSGRSAALMLRFVDPHVDDFVTRTGRDARTAKWGLESSF